MDVSANGEKLAAYLADELPADERAALEARLARDATLRRRLDAIRRADAALAALPPVGPSEAFSRQLRAVIREELAQTDGGADELANRRERRRTRFLRGAGLAAAAAGVVAVASFGVASLLSGGDDADTAIEMAAPADESLALVQVSDTDYSADSLESLTDRAVVDPDDLHDLSDEQALELAQRNAEALGFGAATASALEAPVTSQEAPADDGGGDTESTSEARLEDAGGAPENDLLIDAQRCATEIMESIDTLIPLLAEFATFEGEPAIMYLFASSSPEDGSFTRLEVWAVARHDCTVLHFTQWQL